MERLRDHCVAWKRPTRPTRIYCVPRVGAEGECRRRSLANGSTDACASTKNPTVWCNLGFLCLQSGDYEIADDAFGKAQIVSPEHSLAWMGKALVALQRGERHLAENLFDQAATLSGGFEVIPIPFR